MPKSILIVEDEKDLVTTLEYNLKREGYQTQAALTGEQALESAFRDPQPDLVLLDLMLPGISGVEVCRRLRQNSRTDKLPVLMLTARGEEIDKVVGFEVGADDYVVKPFKVRELLLRVRAILRRCEPTQVTPNETTEFGMIRIDHSGHRVWIEDEEITLTAMEFRMLGAFLNQRGKVLSREHLLNDVWGMNAFVVQTRTVDAHVKRLRVKLGSAGNYIETIRGVGYRFRGQPEASEAA
ncbi:MAG: response regulator transcription factor [Magnetococcales bacterium]|nr:response regulator transcription factor [Magnetococcales bacterium]